MVNSLGRELPEFIGGYRVRPYQGLETAESTAVPVQSKRIVERCQAGQSKLLGSLKEALLACGLKDGMTISFHHSFREGDLVVGQVMEAIGELGIKNLRFAPSAVVNLKNFSLAKYVEDGTITRVEASGIRGELGDRLIDGSVQTG